jgi:phosphate transport system substrate-binding protein
MKKLELKNKHLKRISLKKIMGGVLFVGITSTIVLTSGILATDPLINAAGSSAVQPLMSAFSNRYPNADLVTQAGGSGAGIRAIIDGTKEIGMASKNPGIMKVGEHGTGVPSEDEIK